MHFNALISRGKLMGKSDKKVGLTNGPHRRKKKRFRIQTEFKKVRMQKARENENDDYY